MKTAKLGDIFYYGEKLVKCLWVNPGKKSIGMETIEDHFCPSCNHNLGKEHIESIESSPNFQSEANPIQSLSIE